MTKGETHDLKPGDDVQYVPDAIHALHKNHHGDYPWVLGRRIVNRARLKTAPENIIKCRRGEEVFDCEVLEGKRVEEYLGFVRRSPDPAKEAKNIVLIEPKELWPAKVKAVNEDGTVNLEIHSGRHGAVHHCDNVPVDNTRKEPHTCCKPVTAQAASPATSTTTDEGGAE